MALNDDLLAELKEQLQVTWEDDGTDKSLLNLITRGQVYFNDLCATEFTFDDNSAERELLLERCRYAWNNALDEFENNFQKELSRLIINTALKQYSEATDSGTGTTT